MVARSPDGWIPEGVWRKLTKRVMDKRLNGGGGGGGVDLWKMKKWGRTEKKDQQNRGQCRRDGAGLDFPSEPISWAGIKFSFC